MNETPQSKMAELFILISVSFSLLFNFTSAEYDEYPLTFQNKTENLYENKEIPSSVLSSEIRFPYDGNSVYPANVSQVITIKSDGKSKIKIYFTKFEMEFSGGYGYDGVAIKLNNATHGFSGFAFQNEYYSDISFNYEYDAKVGSSDYFYQNYSVDYLNDEVSEFVGLADGDVEIITKTDPTVRSKMLEF